MRRALPYRVLALVVLAWVVWLTGARDLLHSHASLTGQRECPACRVERTVGVMASTAAALVEIPVLVPLGLVADLRAVDYTAGDVPLDTPPRGPPLPA